MTLSDGIKSDSPLRVSAIWKPKSSTTKVLFGITLSIAVRFTQIPCSAGGAGTPGEIGNAGLIPRLVLVHWHCSGRAVLVLGPRWLPDAPG